METLKKEMFNNGVVYAVIFGFHQEEELFDFIEGVNKRFDEKRLIATHLFIDKRDGYNVIYYLMVFNPDKISPGDSLWLKELKKQYVIADDVPLQGFVDLVVHSPEYINFALGNVTCEGALKLWNHAHDHNKKNGE